MNQQIVFVLKNQVEFTQRGTYSLYYFHLPILQPQEFVELHH